MIFIYGVILSRWSTILCQKTLDDLGANIEREINKISKNILKSTILTFQKRRELIFSAENGHIEINKIF